MADLVLIGYWLGPYSPGWPDVQDFVDSQWDILERKAVADWLRSGEKYLQAMGYSTCRFCGRRNGSAELTDGVYIWPEGLAHYLEDHEVRVPGRIVERALLHPPIDRDNLAAIDADLAKAQALGAQLVYPIDGAWWRRIRPDWTTD